MIDAMRKSEWAPNVVRLSWVTGQRRKITAGLASHIFDYRLHADTKTLQTLYAHLHEGYGVELITPHIDKGDHFRALSSLMLAVPELRRREIVLPAAKHQINSFGLKALAKLTGIHLSPIVTRDTLRKAGHIESALGDGNREYAKLATEVMRTGGGIDLSPQGGRRPDLSSWENEGKPIRSTDVFLRRGGVDNVAYVILGIERSRFRFIPWIKEKDYSKRTGMNLFRRYNITIGEIITSDELRRRADGHGNTLDEEVRQLMLVVAPKAYIPKPKT